jgi:hypothetical protein
MRQIRDDLYEITFTDLGSPAATGYYPVDGLGEVLIDAADVRYIQEHQELGYEPTFFVRRSPALKGAFTVTARQWKA